MRTVRILLVVFAVALLPRALGVEERSFWLDEAETMEAALAPDVPALLERVATVEIGKGPVYYLALRGWAGVFGTGEAALRWLSVLAGAAAAAAVALWALLLFREERREAELPALLAGLVAALHPFLVSLSRDARSFAMSHAFLFLAAALSVPAFRGHRPLGRRLAALAGVAAFAALGVSCHLYAGFFVAGLFAAAAIVALTERTGMRWVLLGAASFALLIALQVPLTLRQLEFRAVHGGVERALTVRDVAASLLVTAGGKPAGVILVLLAGAVAVAGRRLAAVRTGIVVLAVALAAPVLVELLGRPILVHGAARYLGFAGGPLALLAGALLLRAGPARLAGAGALLAVLVAGLAGARAFEREHAEDWRAVAEVLEEEVRPGDVVVCHRTWVERPLALYYGGHLAGRVTPDRVEGGATVPGTAPLRFASAPRGRVFLVWSHAGEIEGPPLEHLEAGLGPAVEVHRQFAVRVFRFSPYLSVK